MKKYILATLLLSGLVSTAAMAEGRGMMGKGGPDGDRRGGPMMDNDDFDRPGDGPGGPQMRRGEPGMKGGFQGDPEQMKKQFNLTDDQVSKIDEINLKYQKEHLDLRGKMEPKRIELKKLLLEDKIDLKKVESILKELSEYQVQSRLLMIKQRIEIESTLTPDQKKKMRSMHDR
jgi:Spy/CpxP family protein refolding chaperone